MNLLIDWGNTQLKSMELNDLDMTHQQLLEWPTKSFESLDAFIDTIEASFGKGHFDGVLFDKVLIASVRNAQQTQKLVDYFNSKSNLCYVAETTAESSGVRCAYQAPNQLGIDRWLAIIAASRYAKTTAVLDVGSAITLDVVTGSGQHLGGHIVPGLKLLRNSLLTTDRVIVSDKQFVAQSFELGQSTIDCVDYGIHQMIEGYLVSAINNAMQQFDVELWIFTGGGGKSWLQRLQIEQGLIPHRSLRYEPNIVFLGLLIEFTQNTSKAR